MMYSVEDRVRAADAALTRVLVQGIRRRNGRLGSPQFVEPVPETEHIGLYATSGVVELLSSELRLGDEDIQDLLHTFGVVLNEEAHHRDAKNTFKICAVLNALTELTKHYSSAGLVEARRKAIEVLLNCRDATSGAWTCAAGPNPYVGYSRHIVSTAYALLALRGSWSTVPGLQASAMFLAGEVRAHLYLGQRLRTCELAAAAIALRSIGLEIPTRVLSARSLEHLDGILYRSLCSSSSFNEDQLSFVTLRGGIYKTSFFVMKTDLAILEYFSRHGSRYLRSTRVREQIVRLADVVLRDGMYRSPETGQPFTRTNAKVLRILRLQAEVVRSHRASRLRTLYYDHQWEPTSRVAVTVGRYLTTGLLAVILPLSYLLVPAVRTIERLAFVASIGAGILATMLHSWLVRPRHPEIER